MKQWNEYGRTFIIAEIGQNHQGELEIAKELIRTAKLCGVDAVKSQKRDIRSLLTPEEYARPYEVPNSFGPTYGAHREALELSYSEYIELLSYSREIGMEFFASPWDVPSARFLNSIGVSLFKVASACLTHGALIKEISQFDKPVILSTGMSTMEEIEGCLATLSDCEISLLQCTSAYPVQFEDIHLKAIKTLRDRFGYPVGLSGHHKGIAVDAAAVALGATLIERHFTLDRTWKGSDHAASLEPVGLNKLVRDIRAVEKALGVSEKKVLECEIPSLNKLRGARLKAG